MARQELRPDIRDGEDRPAPVRAARWSVVSYFVVGAAIAATLAGTGYWIAARPNPPTVEILIPTPTSPAPVIAHVVGAVHAPGVYSLPPGSRVDAALAAAGGPTADADVDAINRAALVTDGQRIDVPRRRAPRAAEPTTPQPAEPVRVATQAPAAAGRVALNDEGGAEPTAGQQPEPVQLVAQPSTAGGLIDLNSASAIELQSLPGIGEKRARDIIEWRSLHGLFTTVDDLLDIPGIGPVTVEKIRPFVTAE